MIRKSLNNHATIHPRGFTLIEILVVIGIISVLASLLFAVVSRAKNGARRVACVNNLKQIGLAYGMYASDNGGRYPNAPTLCAWADRVLPYVQKTSFFECPSAKNSPYKIGCPPVAASDNLDEFGAPVNYHGGYDMVLFNSKNFTHHSVIRRPSDTIAVLDGSGKWIIPGQEDLSNPEVFESTGIMPPRHQNGSNVLFFDSHVKWMTYDSLRDRTLWNLNKLQ